MALVWTYQTDKAARQNARTNLKALRKQRTELAEWYGPKSVSADAWKQIKKVFQTHAGLSDAWGRVENEFDSRE